MNQILDTQDNKNYLSSENGSTNSEPLKNKRKKVLFTNFQFTFSLCIFISLLILLIIYAFSIIQKENSSNKLIDNYSIFRLYSDYEINDNISTKNKEDVFGFIEIPTLKIYYPIFWGVDDELLKISPCRIFGDSLDENGNLCIAGHNYNNYMFFSKINTLNYNDEIFIYDINQKKYVYLIYDIYEVSENDLSPILDYDENYKNLTLITCNNLNSKRIIVKAKQDI